MMQKLRDTNLRLQLAGAAAFGMALAPLGNALAKTVDCSNPQDLTDNVTCGSNASAPTGVANNPNANSLSTGLHNIANLLIFLIGAIAVIIIIVSGLRFVTSNGDANAAKGAREAIVYAVVGLIVAILAYAIVNFVVKAFT